MSPEPRTEIADVPQLDERGARKLIARINANIDDVASLLVQLYYGKGWSAMGYTSWKECCKQEFGRSASWASRQISAAEQRRALPIGNDSDSGSNSGQPSTRSPASAPIPESHLRELRKAGNAEQQRAAWLDALNRFGTSVTAKQLAEVVAERNTIDVGETENNGEEQPDEPSIVDSFRFEEPDQTGQSNGTDQAGGINSNTEEELQVLAQDFVDGMGQPAKPTAEPNKLNELRRLLDECCYLYGDETVETLLTDWFDVRAKAEATKQEAA